MEIPLFLNTTINSPQETALASLLRKNAGGFLMKKSKITFISRALLALFSGTVASLLFMFTSCVDGVANDGTSAEERLNKGYTTVGGGEGGNALFTGCFIWSANGPEALTLTFTDTEISAWTAASWGGFGLGKITADGTAFVASSDLTPLASVEFDVVAGVSATCKIQIGSGAEQDLVVTTTKEHKTYSVSGLGPSNYVILFNDISKFPSEDKKLQITNLVFKDASGNQIKEFKSGDVIPD